MDRWNLLSEPRQEGRDVLWGKQGIPIDEKGSLEGEKKKTFKQEVCANELLR